METQSDTRMRVVALSNLKAMCERVSVIAHRYWIESYSDHRVCVGYSNPDEYGTESAMYAWFPAFRSGWQEDKENPYVVFNILRVTNDNWDGEGWQAFDPLLEYPTLWRDPITNEWYTREEIENNKHTN